jgi:glycosyltransferase involved in cell wall biosynthesis
VKFCMVTTFFGARSFGGDAAFVDRLARALLRLGHEVHVVHCGDAFDALRGAEPLRPYTPPRGLHVHELRSRLGALSPIATQATGRPWLKAAALRRHLDDLAPDVVHFHNISLVGGPGVLAMGRDAVRIMTAHEYWLFCPMHLLWKYDREPCDGPSCARCMIAGRRPPQLWRATGAIQRGLRQLDALIVPSRHALEEHRRRGIAAPLVVLPHFLPDDWSGGIEDFDPPPAPRPYLAAAGRLVRMKGFQRVIPLMRFLPEADLRIAGSGPFEPELRRLAAGLPNVRFEGLLGGADLARLFHSARAVVVPSLFPETFGLVALEAFAVRTPTIVHRAGGALHEVAVRHGGGVAFDSDAELLLAMRRLVHDDELRDELAARGYAARRCEFSERAHLDRYFDLIRGIQARRAATGPAVPAPHLNLADAPRAGAIHEPPPVGR